MSLCQLVLVGEEGALRVQYVLERRKALLIEVKGKIQGLFSLVYHFPEGYDLLDRVLVRAHGVIHFLYGGKHGLVELPDRLVQLGFRQPGSLYLLGALEEVPRKGRGDLIGQAIMIRQLVEVVGGETDRAFHEYFRPPIGLRGPERGGKRIDLPFCRTYIRTA